MAKRIYTDEDRAQVKALLEATNGNVTRVAADTGIPKMTVSDWKRKWEREGAPPAVREVLPAVRENVVEEHERLRNRALHILDLRLDLLEQDRQALLKVSPKDLATTAAILTDKARLIEGKPTSQPDENSSGGNLPIEQVRELFAGLAKGLVEGARQRERAISSAMEEEPIEDGVWEQAEAEDAQPEALPMHVL